MDYDLTQNLKRKTIIDRITKIQSTINVFLLGFLLVVIAVQIVLRYVFKISLIQIEEILIFPIIWLYLLGGASASLENKHIECGMLESFIVRADSFQLTVIAKSLISVAVCFALSYYCFGLFSYSLMTWKTTGILGIPYFWAESSLFICTILMAIYSTIELTKQIVKYKNIKKGLIK